MRRLLALCIVLLGSLGDLSGETYLIIPFRNASGAPNLDWIGESISETVREALVSYGVLALTREEREEVAHRLSIRPSAQLTKATIIKLAQELGADRVVFGEFHYTPGQDSESPSAGSLTIQAQSINVRRLARGSEWRESGAMAELSQLQTRLAWRILTDAAPGVAPGQKEFFKAHAPVRIDAMESYVRGLLAPALEQKHRFFTQAVHLEPDFSQPCFQLGRMQWDENSYRVAAGWLDRVHPEDAHYLEASFLLGLCRYHTGDYTGALTAFGRVARSAPLNEVYNNLGLAQFHRQLPEALGNVLKALNGDPDDPDYHFNAGYLLWREGDLAGAAEHFRQTLAIDPEDTDARQLLERCEKQKGPRRGDLSTEGLERLKENYEEIVYRRLMTEQEETEE